MRVGISTQDVDGLLLYDELIGNARLIGRLGKNDARITRVLSNEEERPVTQDNQASRRLQQRNEAHQSTDQCQCKNPKGKPNSILSKLNAPTKPGGKLVDILQYEMWIFNTKANGPPKLGVHVSPISLE